MFNAGFSLAESVVMGVILGVVSMALLNTVKQQHSVQSHGRYYDMINLIMNTVENHLIDYKKSKGLLNSFTKDEVSSASGKSILGIIIKPMDHLPNKKVLQDITEGGPGLGIISFTKEEVSNPHIPTKGKKTSLGIIKKPKKLLDDILNKKFLQVSISNVKGEVNNKDIKQARTSNDHLIKNKLYISGIKLFYKRKFESIESSSSLSKEEHGLVFVEISFNLKVGDVEKTIKRRTSVNVVYDSSNKISKTLSPGERLAKVLEDEVCNTKYGGEIVGRYDGGKCRGYKKLAGKAVRNKSCKELGGTITTTGECRYDFFEPGVTECPDGISGFNAQGNAICSSTTTPPLVEDFVPVVNISEYYTVCVINKKQSLKCWGKNPNGQVGIGNTTDQTSPQGVDLGGKPVSIGSGYNHTCALLTNGTVKCWGENDYGQLGLGHTTQKHTPQKVTVGGKKRTAVSLKVGTEHACALLDNGNLKCWGINGAGQVGIDKTSTTESTPKKVAIDKDRTIKLLEVKSGNSCVILDDGTLQCWGANRAGEVGIGESDSNKHKPTNVKLGGKAESISIGYYHTLCAILDTGTLKCWGANGNGQLGIGGDSLENQKLPQTVDLGDKETAVFVRNDYTTTCAILATGTLKCWGQNRFGEVGVGDSLTKNTPQTVDLGTERTAKSLAMGFYFTCAILDDDTLKCWGRNTYGQVGVGSTTHQETPEAINLGKNRKAKAIRMGQSSACALLDNNALKCWGQNSYGEVGIGSTEVRTSPKKVKL